MAKPLLHESDGLLNPNSNMDRFVDNDSKENTKKTDNWKVSLISGSCACTAVFIVNLGFTIWSSVSLKDIEDSTKTSRRIMYEGSCSTTRNSYEVFVADRDLHLLENYPRYKHQNYSVTAIFKSRNIIVSQLDNLTALECINKYGVAFQAERIDVILVVDNSTSKIESKQTHEINSTLSHNVRRGGCIAADYDWICPMLSCNKNPCHAQLPEIKRQPDDWITRYGDKVKYCLSQPALQRCRLNFDISIASIVLVVNFVKAIVLAYIVIRPPKEPLFVLGDAIQSFMTRPDENSCGSCLASARTVHEGLVDTKRIAAPERRGVAVTRTRWLFSFVMYGVTFSVSWGLLGYGIDQIYGPDDFKSLWGLGFGTANELTLIYGSAGFSNEPQREPQNIFPKVLVSNIPQLIFSILYFQYNSLYTAMAAAKEWSDFGRKRRPLRVSSSPRGQQRSRYFLQLPYRYSIPLILVSILVHWMLSQSIFIVIVEEYENIIRAFNIEGTVVTCGYSPLAIICVVTTSGLMAVAIIITALRRLPTGMPVAASCSLAIAAACRQPDGVPHPEEASLLPLQWGVMTIERKGSDREITDHCGFSHEPVEKPEDGHMYY
ncbi:hypothetical protein HYE67_010263 [Fusarium culmorum]|uniref:DUF6536 domain-containing protein n=1 Tax=Fusarium culmorum TaxID=5516 RepID=A0A7S8DGB3_FUSCU|nr:hypothetical protein HYE67_010263 [Fusarium culmorum]